MLLSESPLLGLICFAYILQVETLGAGLAWHDAKVHF
jgi:hypothetical protein